MHHQSDCVHSTWVVPRKLQIMPTKTGKLNPNLHPAGTKEQSTAISCHKTNLQERYLRVTASSMIHVSRQVPNMRVLSHESQDISDTVPQSHRRAHAKIRACVACSARQPGVLTVLSLSHTHTHCTTRCAKIVIDAALNVRN